MFPGPERLAILAPISTLLILMPALSNLGFKGRFPATRFEPLVQIRLQVSSPHAVATIGYSASTFPISE